MSILTDLEEALAGACDELHTDAVRLARVLHAAGPVPLHADEDVGELSASSGR